MTDEKTDLAQTEHAENPEENAQPEDTQKSNDILVDEKEEYVSPEAQALGMSQEMYEATHGSQKDKTWSKGHIKLYAVCSLLYLFSSMSGYDGSLMSSVNVMKGYQDYFGMETSGPSTGMVFSISSIASIAAAGFVWLADVIGRRWTIIIGLVGTIVGVVLVSVATTMEMLIGGRFVLFFFTAIGYVSLPPYLVEISPPNLRGSLSGLMNVQFYCGSTIATLACYGSKLNYGDHEKSFKVPFWCQLIPAGIIFFGIVFAPESPRWLIARGQEEKARKIMQKYHANGVANHPIIDFQIAEIKAELEMSPVKSIKDYFNIWDLFTTRSKRYRMFLACTWSLFGNATGSQVLTYYTPQFFNSVGITSNDTQLLLNAVYAIVGWIFATAGALLHDVLGRRTMMLISTAGIMTCFFIISISSACYLYLESKASSVVSILFIYVFSGIFAFAYTSMQPVYPAEVTTNAMRVRAMAFYQVIFNLAGFILGFCGSMAMEKMKFGFYIFFFCWNSFTFTIIYFFFVETKGRTLEELEEVFSAPNPRKASLIKKREAAHRAEDSV